MTETPRRRSQAERRASTRAALLDAALITLVKDGYANFTTRGVAERAGFSQGTQQHYFESKAGFVVEAMRYAVQVIRDDTVRRLDISGLTTPGEQERLLDEIWRVHQSLAFKAALELWNAARADEQLRETLRQLEREVTEAIRATSREVLSRTDADPAVLDLLDLALSAVRGLAMLAPVVPQAVLERRWITQREHLADLLRRRVNPTRAGPGEPDASPHGH